MLSRLGTGGKREVAGAAGLLAAAVAVAVAVAGLPPVAYWMIFTL